MKVLLCSSSLILLDCLVDSTLFMDSHPSVYQAVPGSMNLGSFLPDARTDVSTS